MGEVGSWSVGVTSHYSRTPLRLTDNSAQYDVIGRRLVADVSAGATVLDWLDASVFLPVVASQSGDPLTAFGLPNERLSGTVLGDLRVVGRARLMESPSGLGLAVAVPVYLPTGDKESFNTDDSVRLEGRVIADWVGPSDILVCTNVGYQLRPTRSLADYTSDDVLRWSVGARVPFGQRLAGTTSVFGAVPVAGSDAPAAPVEALAGLQLALPSDLSATVAGGVGIGEGVGAPQYRILLALSYAHRAQTQTVVATLAPTPEATPEATPLPTATPVPSAKGTMAGVVRDADSGMPLAAATIRWGNASTKTDRFGRFEVPDIPVGAVTLEVRAEGYRVKTSRAVVAADQTVKLTLELKPDVQSTMGTFGGDVHARNGRALKASLVIAGGGNSRTVETDATGSFNLDLVPGTYTVRVHAPGYRDETKTIVIKAEELSVYSFTLDR